MKIFYSAILFFIVPHCMVDTSIKDVSREDAVKISEESKESVDSPYYDLVESTRIILSLIKKNELNEILFQDDLNSPENIDTLLYNFSPAQMAFEAEVLNYPGTAIILYYTTVSEQENPLKDTFIQLAPSFINAKFVLINSDKLFKLAEEAVIESFPSILMIKDRKEIDRLENPNPETVASALSSTLKK